MSAFPLAGLLCPLLFVVFLVMVIIAIVRAVSNRVSRGPRNRSFNVPTQLDQDGFWMDSCPADPGALIHYLYWSGGIRYSGQVPFKPGVDGRQFVYTGRPPDQVSIANIVEADDEDLTGSMVAASIPWVPTDTFSPPSSPPASSSFPAAY